MAKKSVLAIAVLLILAAVATEGADGLRRNYYFGDVVSNLTYYRPAASMLLTQRVLAQEDALGRGVRRTDVYPYDYPVILGQQAMLREALFEEGYNVSSQLVWPQRIVTEDVYDPFHGRKMTYVYAKGTYFPLTFDGPYYRARTSRERLRVSRPFVSSLPTYAYTPYPRGAFEPDYARMSGYDNYLNALDEIARAREPIREERNVTAYMDRFIDR